VIFADKDTGALAPEKCLEEVDAAIRMTRSYMACGLDQMRRYVGPYYTREGNDEQAYPENHYFSYVSLVVPKIIFRNPRVRTTTARGGGARMAAKAVEHGINRWIRDNEVRKFLSQGPAVDMLFGWGVVLTANEPLPAHQPLELPNGTKVKTPFMPRVYRISPVDFFQDPSARCERELRFRGHVIRRDKEDLIAEAEKDSTWNLDAVRMLEASGDLDQMDRDGGRVPFRRSTRQVDRNQVEYFEVWVPELGVDDGDTRYNGQLLTLSRVLASDGKVSSAWMREPRDYYGPRWGPYSVFGCYYASDSALPLAPLPAIEQNIRSLNELRVAADIADKRYKRMVFVPDVDSELADKIQHSPTDHVMALKNLDVQGAKVFQVEVGGASPALREAIEVHRRTLFEISGMDDAQRGSVTGAGTATEHQIADASAAARLDYIRQRFQDGVEHSLKTVAWYLYHDNNIAFPVEASEEQMELGQEAWFLGGEGEADSGYTYDDLEMEIEPYSMERTNEGLNQERAQAAIQVFSQIVPMAAQFPDGADWVGLLNDFGDAMNTPNLGEKLNVEGAAAAMQQQSQGGASPSQVQPRLVSPVKAPQLSGGPAGRPSGQMKPKPVGSPGAQQKPAVKQIARSA